MRDAVATQDQESINTVADRASGGVRSGGRGVGGQDLEFDQVVMQPVDHMVDVEGSSARTRLGVGEKCHAQHTAILAHR